MTRSRGYHSYRGRTPKWKVVLAIVLVLVILGAVGFMVLQEHIVYDGTGTPHLRLPQQETEDTGTPPEEEEPVEVVIQEPEGPREIHAFSLPAFCHVFSSIFWSYVNWQKASISCWVT